MKNMTELGEKLKALRKQNNYSLEYAAEKINVTRQTVSKWESGETIPDVLKCKELADLYDVSLDELLLGKNEAPSGKYLFGMVKVGERGQVVIPRQARDVFNIRPGDRVLFLGDIHKGMAIVKVDEISDNLFPGDD